MTFHGVIAASIPSPPLQVFFTCNTLQSLLVRNTKGEKKNNKYIYRAPYNFMKPQALLLLLLLPLTIWAKLPGNEKLPGNNSLVFLQNAGQVTDQHGTARKDIDYKLDAPGMNIFIGKGQIHYQWVKANPSPQGEINASSLSDNMSSPLHVPNTIGGGDKRGSYTTYRMDVTLVGANTNAEVITEEPQPYYENYYLPQCPNGATAHSFKKITYKNIYPNIDWVLYIASPLGDGRGLKYDFIVHEGGNAKDIQIRYDGATAMALNNGAVTATTPFGSITENAPYSYDAKTKATINSKFTLKDNILSIDVGPHTGTLVIDPQIEWATYYGGEGYDGMYEGEITTDSSGCLYLAGHSSSATNIATTGAFQTINNGYDGFIVRFDGTGKRLWGTYYGGNSSESFHTVATSKYNNVYVAGWSQSPNLGTPGTHKDTLTLSGNSLGTWDGIVAKFDSMGQRVWATYYGGKQSEHIWDIVVDKDDNIYMTGYTLSEEGIATPNCHQYNFEGQRDAFVAKFTEAGILAWGTYYGGVPKEITPGIISGTSGNAIELYKNKDIYISGYTHSINNIASAGAHSEQLNTDSLNYSDGFVAKFDTNGKFQWGTYYGGNNADVISDIDIDTSGNVYVVGQTQSVKGIATQQAFKSYYTSPSEPDAFLAKFSPTGKLVWGTYYGGNENDFFSAIQIDYYGDISAGGGTVNKTAIATTGAWKATITGNVLDAMLIKFDRNGNRLWGTYYGGSENDYFRSIAVNNQNNVYIHGLTRSNTDIATPGAHQEIFGGNMDYFIIKSSSDSIVYLEQPFNDTVICFNSKGAHVKVGYIVSRSFRAGNIFNVEMSDSTGNFNNPVIIGSVTGTASGYIYCSLPPSTLRAKGYRIRVTASAPFYISNDNGIDIDIKDGPEHPLATGDTLLCTGKTLMLTATCPTPGVSFVWTGPNGFSATTANTQRSNIQLTDSGNYIVTVSPYECRTNDTIHLRVYRTPVKPLITHNTPICEGDTFRFSYQLDSVGTFYTWAWPDTSTAPEPSNVLPNISRKYNGEYIVVANHKGCSAADTANIIIKPKPILTITSNSPLKAGDELKISASANTGSVNYLWEGPDGFISSSQQNSIKNASLFNGGTYTVRGTDTSNGCTDSTAAIVVVTEADEDIFILFPNPNDGSFTIRGNLRTDQLIQMRVVNATGQLIYSDKVTSAKKQINHSVTLPAVANGEYMLHLRYGGKSKTIPFIVGK